MKCLAYTKNFIPVNVYAERGNIGATENFEYMNVNYKYVDNMRISIETEKPIYYAIFDDGRQWRTISVAPTTNTKWLCTLLLQNINVKNLSLYDCLAEDKHLSSNSTKVAGNIADYFITNRKHLKCNKTIVTGTDEKLGVIIQTTVKLEDSVVGSYIPDHVVTPSTLKYKIPKVFNVTSDEREFVYADSGLYMYFTEEIEYVNPLIEKLATQENGFVGAFLCRIPTRRLTWDIEKSIVLNDGEEIDVYLHILEENSLEPSVFETITENERTIKRKFWVIGDKTVYPCTQGLASLYRIDFIGVNTLYTLYYGDNRDLDRQQFENSVVVENAVGVGYSVLNPSIYYGNNQFQSLVKANTILSYLSSAVGSIGGGALTGALAGKSFGGKGMIIGGVVGGIAGAFQGGKSVVGAEQTKQQYEYNKSSLTQTNDVLQMLPYLNLETQVVEYDYTDSDLIVNATNIFNSYACFITGDCTFTYIGTNPTLLKGIPKEHFVNESVLIDGIIIVFDNDDLNDVFSRVW